MPVRKFRSVQAMNQPVWRTPGDPALFRAIEVLWTAGMRTQGRRFPPGVHKYRSVEELDAQVQRWQQEHIERRRSGARASRP